MKLTAALALICASSLFSPAMAKAPAKSTKKAKGTKKKGELEKLELSTRIITALEKAGIKTKKKLEKAVKKVLRQFPPR